MTTLRFVQFCIILINSRQTLSVMSDSFFKRISVAESSWLPWETTSNLKSNVECAAHCSISSGCSAYSFDKMTGNCSVGSGECLEDPNSATSILVYKMVNDPNHISLNALVIEQTDTTLSEVYHLSGSPYVSGSTSDCPIPPVPAFGISTRDHAIGKRFFDNATIMCDGNIPLTYKSTCYKHMPGETAFTTLAQSLSPMSSVGNWIVNVPGDKMWITGGFIDVNTHVPISNKTFIINPDDSIVNGPPALPDMAQVCACQLDDTKTIIMGGYIGHVSKKAIIYDWNSHTYMETSPMLVERLDESCAQFTFKNGTRMTMIIGSSSDDTSKIVELYDSVNDVWFASPHQLNVGRSQAGLYTYGFYAFVFAGYANAQSSTTGVERYREDLGWHSVKDLQHVHINVRVITL